MFALVASDYELPDLALILGVHRRPLGTVPRLRKPGTVGQRSDDPEPVRSMLVLSREVVAPHPGVGVHCAPGQGIAQVEQLLVSVVVEGR